jgi:hypothetical protein
MTGFIIFVIIAVVSNLLSKAKQADVAKRTPASPLPPPDDLEQAARTRRIQEEIRRKIAERRGGAAGPEAASPAESEWDVRQRQIREEIRRKAQPDEEPKAEPAREIFSGPAVPPLDPFGGRGTWARRTFEERVPEPPPLPAQPAGPEPARQSEIAAQLSALREARAAAEATAAAREAETQWTEATKPAVAASAWRKDLRSAADLRRAMVLREVLGPPVALR